MARKKKAQGVNKGESISAAGKQRKAKGKSWAYKRALKAGYLGPPRDEKGDPIPVGPLRIDKFLTTRSVYKALPSKEKKDEFLCDAELREKAALVLSLLDKARELYRWEVVEEEEQSRNAAAMATAYMNADRAKEKFFPTPVFDADDLDGENFLKTLRSDPDLEKAKDPGGEEEQTTEHDEPSELELAVKEMK